MRRPTLTIPMGILALTSVVVVLYAFGIHAGFRPALAIAFLLICPGVALVRHVRPGDIWEQLTLGIALSVALATLVGTVLVYALGDLHPGFVVFVLAAVAAGASVVELRRGDGSGAGGGGGGADGHGHGHGHAGEVAA
jgi:hypothetical protein